MTQLHCSITRTTSIVRASSRQEQLLLPVIGCRHACVESLQRYTGSAAAPAAAGMSCNHTPCKPATTLLTQGQQNNSARPVHVPTRCMGCRGGSRRMHASSIVAVPPWGYKPSMLDCQYHYTPRPRPHRHTALLACSPAPAHRNHHKEHTHQTA